MQASLFLTLTNNQSQNYLINFNCLTIRINFINYAWSALPKQNACRLCKLNNVISFNPTVRFGNQTYNCDL